MHNLINFFQPCFEVITEQLPNVLIYYSHLPAIFLAIFFAVFLFFKNRKVSSDLNTYFISVGLLFALWASLDLVVWTLLYDSSITMTTWAVLELVEVLFFYVSTLLSYRYMMDRDMPLQYKVLLLIPPLVIWFYTISSDILNYYSLYVCEAIENSFIINDLMLVFDISYLVIIAAIFYTSFIKFKINRLKNTIFFLGLGSSLLVYLFSLYISDYVNDYNWSLFALASMPIFLLIVGFSSVRFKIFNFKILGVNLLMFASVFIVGTQFIFIRSQINIILNAVTFILLMFSGYFLVRSVKKVDTQRELLETANNEQEILIHFITHQIKGFFTKSRNIFDTLTDNRDALSPSLNRLIDEGLRSDKEGVELVENILNASNLRTGKIKYTDTVFDLSGLVTGLVKDFESLATSKNIAINYHPSATSIMVSADEVRVKDLFKNLIHNSILYTFKGGVNISLAQNGNNVEFVVKDTGVGLTASDKARLFQSGGRGEESVKYNTSSTGYGLFIAKKVVDNYNGQIWAESEGRDKGSKFSVVLPIAQTLVK